MPICIINAIKKPNYYSLSPVFLNREPITVNRKWVVRKTVNFLSDNNNSCGAGKIPAGFRFSFFDNLIDNQLK
jgi:hypothetical protein